MLRDADLDAVNWNALSRPYEEQRIPALFRALRHAAFGGRDQYVETFGELANEINHQGTIYEVTAHAIPFLIDLVRGDVISDQVEIVADLLVWLGDLGEDTLYKEENTPRDVQGFNPATGEPIIIRAINDRPAAKTAREALRQGLDVFLGHLVKGEGQVRCAATYALAHYPDQADRFGPPIMAALHDEADGVLRAGMLLAFGYLRDASPGSGKLLKQTVEAGKSEQERVAAAVALAHIPGQGLFPPALATLRRAWDSNRYRHGISEVIWSTRRLVEKAFERAGLAE